MNQYTLQSKLGQGAFSVVYKVKRKEDGLDYAMKKMRIMSFSEKEISNCLNEVRILASISDEHIVDYKDSFFDELTNTFCIVTEYLQGGDVAHVISKHKNMKKSISQNLIWQVAFHALKGLKTLHAKNIFHRDIKSANIFLTKDNRQAKLGDMNVSTVSANGMARTQTGTPYYASPEVWNEKAYTSKCDIWSLGCVLYQMASFRPPFVSSDLRNLKKVIVNGVYKKIPPMYSLSLEKLIKMCLQVNQKERPSADDLLNCSEFRKYFEDPVFDESRCSSVQLIEKIRAPKKREFRIIKERLPKSRFSSEKSLGNSQIYDKENKENIPNQINEAVSSSRITKKQNLPALKRPISMGGKTTVVNRGQSNQVAVIEPVGRPPLPKNKLLRS